MVSLAVVGLGGCLDDQWKALAAVWMISLSVVGLGGCLDGQW